MAQWNGRFSEQLFSKETVEVALTSYVYKKAFPRKPTLRIVNLKNFSEPGSKINNGWRTFVEGKEGEVHEKRKYFLCMGEQIPAIFVVSSLENSSIFQEILKDSDKGIFSFIEIATIPEIFIFHFIIDFLLTCRLEIDVCVK